jgi:ring-1,2-phenylacetyl-CoA epoxidase subunit PaaD
MATAATSLDTARVHDALRQVEDPEIPVTLHDLGVLRDVEVDDDRVSVTMVPTRLGCPARGEMERRVRAAIADVSGDAEVEVRWEMARWTSEAISPEGCTSLRDAGYTPGGAARTLCPYCDSAEVRREGEFGGALCKVPFTCTACGSTFDALASAVLPVLP